MRLLKRLIPFILFMFVGYVAWGVVSDLKLNSIAFMQAAKVKFTKRLDDSARILASDKSTRYPILWFPLNEKNYRRLSGKWQIYNFINVRDEDEAMNIAVNFELVGNSMVKVDDEPEQLFRISYLTDENTIALIKKMPNGFEILEARKIKGHEVKKIAPKATQKKSKEVKKKGIMLSDVDLILEKALFPGKSNIVLENDNASGRVTIISDTIQNLEVSLKLENGERINFEAEFSEINHGGTFSVEKGEETISGIITNNGKNSFRIRFATGPLSGALLNFITQEEFDMREEKKLEALESNQNENRMEKAKEMVQEKIKEQDNATQNRSEANQDAESGPVEASVDQVSPEEMAIIIKKSGFDFAPPQAKREIASEK